MGQTALVLAAAARRGVSSTYSYRGLYLLHFDPPYEHARHYLGYAKRGIRHYVSDIIRGKAFCPHPLIEAAILAGCEITLARTWPGSDRAEQRRLRRNGSLSRFCPICIEQGTNHR